MQNAIVLFSGGIDSTVLAHHLRAMHMNVTLLSIDYGQRHCRELLAAQQLAILGGFPWKLCQFAGAGELLGTSCLTNRSRSIPHTSLDDTAQQATVVPNRNALMLSLACGWAEAGGVEMVAYGATLNDQATYPDCRLEFVVAYNQTLQATRMKVRVTVPFVTWTKRQVVQRGRELAVPLHLCWSCYEGGEQPCGKCGACLSRMDASNLEEGKAA